jgi:hypothetical protein
MRVARFFAVTTGLLVIGTFYQSPAVSATFECKTITTAGLAVGYAQAIASISQDDVKAGFRLTGGGCLDMPGAAGEHYGYLEKSVPDNAANSYTCSVRGVNDKDGIRISAYAVACR